MEMKYCLTWSNDPKYIIPAINSFGGNCYYANYNTNIIREGCFLPGSDKLNGFGVLLNYNNPITITTGQFIQDNPITDFVRIISKDFYKNNAHYSYCSALKETVQNNKTIDTREIYLELLVDDKKIIAYNEIDRIHTKADKCHYNNIFIN